LNVFYFSFFWVAEKKLHQNRYYLKALALKVSLSLISFSSFVLLQLAVLVPFSLE
jgi:hypothetical protein